MDTSRWTNSLEESTKAFKSEFGNLTHQEINWKPHAGIWSVAQIISHLIAVNDSYFPVIASVRNGTYQPPLIGKVGFLVNWMGNMILKSVRPETSRKTKTLPLWEPATSEVPAEILGKFELNQIKLSAAITSCSDLLDRGQIISSPANRNIVYTLEKAFDIITTHERRHLLQAIEVLGRSPYKSSIQSS